MGKRGKQPKLAHLKLLEGNPGNRPVPEGFIEAQGSARKPRWVQGYAAELWYEIVKVMPKGIYTAADSSVLAAYCLAVDQLKQATEHIQIEGAVVRPAYLSNDGDVVHGKPVRNPWGTVAREAKSEIIALGNRLGLDPVARENIKVPDNNKPKSKFGDYTGAN